MGAAIARGDMIAERWRSKGPNRTRPASAEDGGLTALSEVCEARGVQQKLDKTEVCNRSTRGAQQKLDQKDTPKSESTVS